MINLKLNNNEKRNLTEEEIEVAMARKLEILILPILKRNINFFYAGGNLKGKANAYKKLMDKTEVEKALNSKSNNNIPVVCKSLCYMVVEILKENGINADTVSCDTDIFKHTDVLIRTKNGKEYIVNYLEDIENIQTGMKTPDFASKQYYDRRYKKFKGKTTTDGKSIDNIDFIDEKILDKIDTNLKYKKQNMYTNDVIKQIKKEFSNFRTIMAKNEWLTKQLDIIKDKNVTEQQQNKIKQSIYDKYNNMTEDEILEKKLDWIFDYYNERMDIKGHTDFVMYYSRLLLKEVLTLEEYNKIKRYDGFMYRNQISNDNKIKETLDLNNQENNRKVRFCMIKLGEKAYVFSTKSNTYAKLGKEEIEELNKYAQISESEKPSDLVLYLCDRGNALPLVFHPLGNKILNERADLIDKNIKGNDRKKLIQSLSKSIITTDEPITSITIPYPSGEKKYIYIDDNDEFVLETGDKKIIYHYNEEKDNFDLEEISNKEK